MLELIDLKTHFLMKSSFLEREKPVVRAVDGVSLSLGTNEVLGIVGESGCGKSTLGKTALRLIPATAGKIIFDGVDITTLSHKELRPYRRHMQIIFQDPVSSLNPRQTIYDVLDEPLRLHTNNDRADRQKEINNLIDRVGIASSTLNRYPHQFSGGQCQRIAIARALAVRPKIIIADEPVSSLDVSIQAQILNLMEELKNDLGLSYLFISHDLAVVNHIADRIVVMYLGQVVEEGIAQDLVTHPRHPYTEMLISAIPVPMIGAGASMSRPYGAIPSPINPPSGCRFHPRCPLMIPRCAEEMPALKTTGDYSVRCHLR